MHKHEDSKHYKNGWKQLTDIDNDKAETHSEMQNHTQLNSDQFNFLHSLRTGNLPLENCSDIHLFFIETELQALAVSAIVSQTPECTFLIYSFSEQLSSKLSERGVQNYHLDKECRGFIDRSKKTRQYLKQISESLPTQIERIHIYFPRIDQFYQNVIINYMQTRYADQNLSFALIPDGLLNILESSSDQKRKISLKEKKRDLILKFIPDIKYHYFDGCKIGADDEIFSNIYMWENISTNYPPKKIRNLNISTHIPRHKVKASKVLVIGQRIINIDKHNEESCQKITDKICNYLKFSDIKTIDYLPHPRSEYMELNSGFNVVNHNNFCAEELIVLSDYSHIVGCCSTAMVNAKVLYNELNVISIGMEDFIRDPEKLKRMKDTFYGLGITVL